MLFKISFKDTPKKSAKTVVVANRNVHVLLIGFVKLPKFWKYVPDEIINWITSNSGGDIAGEEDTNANVFNLSVSGHAKCHEDDKFDYEFGVRLAEARAKYRIYRFFYHIAVKLYNYYDEILYGFPGVVDCGSGDCIASEVLKYEKMCIREAKHIEKLLKDKKNG